MSAAQTIELALSTHCSQSQPREAVVRQPNEPAVCAYFSRALVATVGLGSGATISAETLSEDTVLAVIVGSVFRATTFTGRHPHRWNLPLKAHQRRRGSLPRSVLAV